MSLRRLERLDAVNLDDLAGALGALGRAPWSGLWRPLARPLVRPFSRALLAFDRDTGTQGLGVSAALLARRLSSVPRPAEGPPAPAEGPVLFVSNHPGLTDTLALFQALGRPDLKVLAAHRPFLQALREVSRALIPVTEGQEAASVGPALRHLRAGGALLTFPAGRIEPDPALHPDEARSLGAWSASTDLFIRLVPGLRVMPVRVSGVLAPEAQGHWLARLRRTRAGREHAAALLQLLVQVWFPGLWTVSPRVERLAVWTPGAVRSDPRRTRDELEARWAGFSGPDLAH